MRILFCYESGTVSLGASCVMSASGCLAMVSVGVLLDDCILDTHYWVEVIWFAWFSPRWCLLNLPLLSCDMK